MIIVYRGVLRKRIFGSEELKLELSLSNGKFEVRWTLQEVGMLEKVVKIFIRFLFVLHRKNLTGGSSEGCSMNLEFLPI